MYLCVPVISQNFIIWSEWCKALCFVSKTQGLEQKRGIERYNLTKHCLQKLDYV